MPQRGLVSWNEDYADMFEAVLGYVPQTTTIGAPYEPRTGWDSSVFTAAISQVRTKVSWDSEYLDLAEANYVIEYWSTAGNFWFPYGTEP